MPPLVFGFPPSGPLDSRAFGELANVVRATTAVDLRPLELPSYAALFEAVDHGSCDVAWAPPLVALDLLSCGAARPVAAVEREGGTIYYSVLVASAEGPVRRLSDLARADVGWVAPQSAAGYVVPRMHLAALGLDLRVAFGRERFLRSHVGAGRALAAGEVDVIATYASYDATLRRLVPPDVGCRVRLVTGAGPIPSDVIVARQPIPDELIDALGRGLRALPTDQALPLGSFGRIRGFTKVSASHLDALRTLRARADGAALRPSVATGLVG